ncbi:hypothetical protein [Streptomyces muensis]|uniref:Uncharacterized protein n=1 Tax=Streptomyces muensis TaxID=1077944 RepID=A0A9X1PZQ2_STRM4|nr:hypothetical protein [Streptomyces muensis]MCF1595214.1 hypothetical protein [Streptomyces muensis]
MRDFVAALRRAISEEGGIQAEGFVTRHNVQGADAEVDFGEVWVDLAGQRVKCYLFAFRLAHSGRAVHRISRSCWQQALFEGHVHALTVLGGVPAGQVRSRIQEENPKWTAAAPRGSSDHGLGHLGSHLQLAPQLPQCRGDVPAAREPPLRDVEGAQPAVQIGV